MLTNSVFSPRGVDSIRSSIINDIQRRSDSHFSSMSVTSLEDWSEASPHSELASRMSPKMGR